MDSLVKHLHAFAREVDLTPEEWLEGIKFLTAVGQTCTPYRQEFILLSDTLGLSTLINALHDKRSHGGGTKTSLLGPFYRQDSPHKNLGESIAEGTDGPQICIYGRVLDAAGHPIPGGTVKSGRPTTRACMICSAMILRTWISARPSRPTPKAAIICAPCARSAT